MRGQLLLVLLVGTVLSLAFWAIGLPYWLLVGAFAGIVEVVPVIGPLAAGALAVGVGLSVSVTTAVWAGAAVLIVRLVEDYLVMPRVLGDAVGLSPLLVLVAVTASGVVFGGLAVLLAIPVAAVLVTLLDVLVLKKDPQEDAPPCLLGRAAEEDIDARERFELSPARTCSTGAKATTTERGYSSLPADVIAANSDQEVAMPRWAWVLIMVMLVLRH